MPNRPSEGALGTAARVPIRQRGAPSLRQGRALHPDGAWETRRFRPNIAIDVDVGVGKGRARVWTCDLTHGYISINADYRS